MKKKSFAFGYAQIVNWFISWMIFAFISAAATNVYKSAVTQFWGFDYAPVLTASSIAGWIGAVVFLIIPIFIRKIGAKKLLVITAILGGICFALTPMFNNIGLIGFFIGCNEILVTIYCCSTTMVLVSKWFPRKKGAVMGIITGSGVLASVVLLPIFNMLINAYGIQRAMLIFGALIALYGVVSIWGLKETPQECGLLPDNMPLDQGNVEMVGSDDAELPLKGILKKGKFWGLSIGWGLELLGTIGFISIAVTYMMMHGVTQNRAIFAMAIVGVVQLLSSVISGFIDQKIGPLKTSWFLFIFQFVGFLICAFYGVGNMLIPMLAVWLTCGMFGAANNLYSSQTLSMFGPKNFTLAFNGLCFITTIVRNFGTFIAAGSVSRTGDYKIAYIIFAILLVFGLVLITLAGDKKIVPKMSGKEEAADKDTVPNLSAQES